ncbi:hypothetical protein PCANC_02596 [Puccinia coronata f. sp. avenae]|uniref:Uncharacterized protein n=1 Tax=Puccinia coronata f. sp. avenae TaxID=200324 RepID=A0A2N5W5M4_9BASI|nr:hypothetical protein PCANC_02596 [Puccinia coronata f. sp. avenae]
MADSHQPNKPNPPPLPPRPLPSNDPTTHQLSAPRLPPRAPVGNLTKLSDGNLPCEVQASTSDSASKSASDSTHPPPQITPVPLPDQALPLDSIPESTLPSPTKLPHSDDLEQAPHVNYYDGANLPTSQPSRQRGDSASDFSLSLDSFVQEAQPAESDCRRTNSYDEKRAEIERLEVSEFIRRSSRYLNEVNFQLVESEATSATPALYDFRSSAGDIDWVGFCNTYAAAQLERHFPNSLRSSTNRAPLSMGQLKAQASRSYVTILPVVWDLISGNRLSSIYRWENPRRTSFYLFTYYLLWAMDMIPSFIVGYGLYMLIERQLNPPTISQLRQEANQRQQLGKQAEAIESEEFLDIKHGTVTKGVLGNSMVFAGVALGSNLSAPGTGKAATDPPPSSSHTLPKTRDYRSMYSFTRRLYSDHGQEIQTMLEDLADMGEKIRK